MTWERRGPDRERPDDPRPHRGSDDEHADGPDREPRDGQVPHREPGDVGEVRNGAQAAGSPEGGVARPRTPQLELPGDREQ